MTARSVLGLDLSLTSTGVATHVRGEQPGTHRIRTKAAGHPRLAHILDQIVIIAEAAEPGDLLVVVEGPAFGAKGSAYHQLAGLWWIVVHHLAHRMELPVAIVPPAALKRYATGKGNAGKDDMLLATARRFPSFAGGNDEADALWLAAMGADHLGMPLVAMPQPNRAALEGVTWPATTIGEAL